MALAPRFGLWAPTLANTLFCTKVATARLWADQPAHPRGSVTALDSHLPSLLPHWQLPHQLQGNQPSSSSHFGFKSVATPSIEAALLQIKSIKQKSTDPLLQTARSVIKSVWSLLALYTFSAHTFALSNQITTPPVFSGLSLIAHCLHHSFKQSDASIKSTGHSFKLENDPPRRTPFTRCHTVNSAPLESPRSLHHCRLFCTVLLSCTHTALAAAPLSSALFTDTLSAHLLRVTSTSVFTPTWG